MSASVLVVEDNPEIRNGMKALISGHTVAVAATVIDALAYLNSATPTHLLLDLNLPDGPGTDVLRRIRGQGSPVRVAIVSGGSDTPLMDEARQLGVEAVFIKPPDWDRLCEWLAHA